MYLKMARLAICIILIFSAMPITAQNGAQSSWSFHGEALLGILGDGIGNFDTTTREANARFHWKFYRHFNLQFNFKRGDVGGDLEGTVNEFGLHLFSRGQRGLIGAYAGRIELSGLTATQLILRGEHYKDDFATLVAAIGYDFRNVSADPFSAALLLRIYPSGSIMIESGLSFFKSLKEDIDATDIEMQLAIEIQPSFMQKIGLSLILEDRIAEIRTIGLRFYMNRQNSLIQRHRQNGIIRTR